MIVDLFLVYQFIKRLATPFSEWEAYKEGVIDERGNILIPKKERRLKRERDSFQIFDLLVLKLKKLLEKIPGGQSRLASYAAAIWLIKEWNYFSDKNMLSEELIESIEMNESLLSLPPYVDYILNEQNVKGKFIDEEPTMSAGSGNIAGIGVGPQGEPGLTPAQQKRYKKKNTKGKRLKDIIGET
jgi:hypothetical protein